MTGIPTVSSLGQVAGGAAGEAAKSGSGEGFAAALRQAVERVNDMQQQSGAEIERFLTGESEDLHKTILSVQKSELAFEMLLEVRNKAVQAYQEIMRIQV
jgi:flagellar hook-basal body complex protein FliE